MLTVMLAMAGLNNGANIQLWSAGPTPISAMALCAGDAQQGKSRLTAAVCAMIAAADDNIAGIVQQMPPPENVNPEEWYQQMPKQFTVRTVGVQDFTPPEQFARCSGEWPQTKEAPDLMDSMPHLKPRAWYSTMVNLDEAYSFLGKIGLTAGDVRGSHSRQGNCSVRTRFLLEHAIGYRQNSARHENERMLWRFGHNRCQLDNRWKLALEDVGRCGTGLVGNHVAATKERSLYCAGAAAKRHEDLSADFVLGEDQPRWTWPPLTAKLADSLELLLSDPRSRAIDPRYGGRWPRQRGERHRARNFSRACRP